MPSEPDLAVVHPTEQLIDAIDAALPEERWGSGARPSRSDFWQYYWPDVQGVIAGSWHVAQSVYDDPVGLDLDIRVLAVRSIGAFPTAAVVFAIADAGLVEPVELDVLGVRFDWSYWPIDQ